ncbi:MAG TPA: hypothetical protein DEA08_12830 [Planctomycetes bacterium]|nr:hypothetical protein [Planctomycetota bacterium]
MRLIYRRGREEVAFPIDEGETYIGRKDYCEICFPDGSLSKRHARLVRRGGRLFAYDAGSRNGTRVNGERVDSEFELFNGDELECGKIRFRVAGIPEGSGAEFEVLEESEAPTRTRHSRHSRSRASRGSGGSMLVTARPVASTDARPSMLDVLPELPPSVEQDGAQIGDEVDDEPRATFKLVDGGPTQEWELSDKTITIGSKDENAVVLVGEGVSRYHAEVVFEDGVWLIKDLGARNGIFVAGEKVDLYELKDGDEVQIGTCRLRFSLVKPDPLAEIKAVIAKVKADPVTAFKTDSRVRIAAVAGAVGVFLLLISLLGGGRGGFLPGGPKSEISDWLTEGCTDLAEGRYLEARNVFLKAYARLRPVEQKVPKQLERVAGLWMTLEKGPSAFRWEKADMLLKATTRLKNLPPVFQDWRAKQFDFVEKNGKALGVIQEAEKIARDGDDAAARPAVDRAIELYDQATARAGQVGRDTLFAARADKLIQSVTNSAFRVLLREANRVTRQTPDWNRGLKMLKRAAEFADSPDDRSKIRTQADKFERNRRDEVAYMRGVAIVRERAVERYPQAREFFEGVHPRSRVYPDARAYLEWIEADIAVRRAKEAYDLGQSRLAFQLLSEALNHDVLGEDAIDSVKRRHTAWRRVVRGFERAREHKAANELAAARKEFELVLRNEKNPDNHFYKEARAEIRVIDEIVKSTYERKVKQVKEALRDQDWGLVHLWADKIINDKNKQPRDVAMIRAEVAEANKKFRLIKRAEREFLHDNVDVFDKMAITLRTLANWLPKDHPDREKAKKLLKKLLPRVRNWKKMMNGN